MKFKYISLVVASVVLLSCSTTKKTAQKEVETVKETVTVVGEEVDRTTRPKAGKAKEISIGNYEEFTLENGLKVFVVENHKLPTISYSLWVNNDPIVEGEKAGYTSILGGLLEGGTTSRPKDKLDEEIDFMGSYISASSGSVYASGLSRYKGEMLNILADITMNPSFPEEEFDKLIKQELTNLEANAEQPDYITSTIKGQVYYGKDHPYGEFVTEESIRAITIDDCKNYYNKHFKPNTSLLTIVGDITLEEAKKLVQENLGAWQKGDIPTRRFKTPQNPNKPQVTVVNKDGAVQSNIALGNVVLLKPGDADYEAVKVLNQIFGSGFSGRLFQNLREDKEYTYGAYGGVSSDKLVGHFTASAKVRNEVTDSAVEQFLYEINRIRTENVTEEELQAAKNLIAGTFAQALESPQTLASFANTIEDYKLPKDYYKNYLKRVNAVTIEDVKNAAIKYMQPNNINIVVVGNAAEVGPKLEKFGTVTYLDKEGFKVDPPAAMEGVEAGVTAQTVINKYLEKIGGEDKIRDLKSVVTVMEATIQGMPVTMTQTQFAPNRSHLKMEAMGMVMMEQTFDGKKAKMTAQGMEQPIPEETMKDMQIEQYIIPELIYDQKGVELEVTGIKDVNGKKAYEVKVTMPSGSSSLSYFDKETGYKIRETSTEDGPTGPVSQSTDFGDYKTVGGVKFPHEIKMPLGGGMTMTAKITSLKVNEKIDPTIFELNK